MPTRESLNRPLESLLLQVALVEDPEGKPVRELRTGEMAVCHIVDYRDIGQYLAKLLGGQSGDASVALASPVEEVRMDEGVVTVRVRLAPGIVGQASVPLRQRVQMASRTRGPWWKRWLTWKSRRGRTA